MIKTVFWMWLVVMDQTGLNTLVTYYAGGFDTKIRCEEFLQSQIDIQVEKGNLRHLMNGECWEKVDEN